MTKIKLSALLLAAGIAFAPLLVVAATLSLSPANVSVIRGQTLTMTVVLNPQGQAAYTTRVELRYSANILEATSFNFASGWLPLTQSGYDLIDNAGGRVVKTAGYPGGVSSTATFGTVSFRAKASGSGAVSIAAESAVYNAQSQNVLTGTPVQASVIISAPAAPATTPITGQVVTTPTPSPTLSPTPEVEESPVVFPTVESQTLLAQIGGLITFGTGRAWVAVLLALVIIGLAYYLTRYFRKGKI